jgi:hypothetical protein
MLNLILLYLYHQGHQRLDLVEGLNKTNNPWGTRFEVKINPFGLNNPFLPHFKGHTLNLVISIIELRKQKQYLVFE